MLIGIPVLETTDWSRLLHAYGRAADTPEHLLALTHDDPEARKRAIHHLWSAILHQNTAWPATAPAALVVAGLLSDERIVNDPATYRELRQFLTEVADGGIADEDEIAELKQSAAFDLRPFLDADDIDGIFENDQAAGAVYYGSILDCVHIRPILVQCLAANPPV